jgi:Fe2+ transport system protein B
MLYCFVLTNVYESYTGLCETKVLYESHLTASSVLLYVTNIIIYNCCLKTTALITQHVGKLNSVVSVLFTVISL